MNPNKLHSFVRSARQASQTAPSVSGGEILEADEADENVPCLGSWLVWGRCVIRKARAQGLFECQVMRSHVPCGTRRSTARIGFLDLGSLDSHDGPTPSPHRTRLRMAKLSSLP